MSGRQHARGYRPLLFERLVGSARTVAGTQSPSTDWGPLRLHDVEQLRASIKRELADLLNTRAPLPISSLEKRPRSAIDYGIPDLSAFPIGERDAMDRLSRHVSNAIAVYEPRLQNPVVEIGRAEGSSGALTVTVFGTLESGTVRAMPVTFTLLPGTIRADPDDA